MMALIFLTVTIVAAPLCWALYGYDKEATDRVFAVPITLGVTGLIVFLLTGCGAS